MIDKREKQANLLILTEVLAKMLRNIEFKKKLDIQAKMLIFLKLSFELLRIVEIIQKLSNSACFAVDLKRKMLRIDENY